MEDCSYCPEVRKRLIEITKHSALRLKGMKEMIQIRHYCECGKLIIVRREVDNEEP